MQTTSIIDAADLNEEIIETLPEAVTDYINAARFIKLGDADDEKIGENNLTCCTVGGKLVIIQNTSSGTTVHLAAITKASTLSLTVEFKDKFGKMVERVVHTTGNIEGDTEIRPTHILRYLPDHFEQMAELNAYRMKNR